MCFATDLVLQLSTTRHQRDWLRASVLFVQKQSIQDHNIAIHVTKIVSFWTTKLWKKLQRTEKTQIDIAALGNMQEESILDQKSLKNV
jgi:hypothetical protein